MKILFLHGLQSKPGGAKVKFLESLGHEVMNPYLPHEDFQESINIAQNLIKEKPDVIVASSRGGAIAMSVCREGIKTILIAPAYKKYDVKPPVSTGNEIVLHSINDDIVPVVDSARLVSNQGYKLHVCGADHRMSDDVALQMLERVL